MDKNKSKLIIVEGPQGTGKTTLTNYLRDNLPGANLYRLSGQKDKTKSGKEISVAMYNALIDYMKVMQVVPMDMIFDRTFFTEEVYARLGYKSYTFTEEYENLLNELSKLNYDIYIISLYLENSDLFKERLTREYHHNYQSFSIENSVNQQNIYKKLFDEVKEKYKNIKVLELSTDNYEKAYDQINKIFCIK